MSYLPLSYYDHPRLHQRESPRLLEAASARREHRAALPGSVKERMLKIWRKLSETTTSDVPHLSYLDLPAMFFCLFYIKGRNSSQNVQNRLVSSQSPFIRIIIHIIPHIEYTVYIYIWNSYFFPTKKYSCENLTSKSLKAFGTPLSLFSQASQGLEDWSLNSKTVQI